MTGVCLSALLLAGRASAHSEKVFACFVYVEPHEVRVEFFSSTDTLGITDEVADDGIDRQEQAAFVAQVRQRLAGAFEVRVDDALLKFEPVEFEFIVMDPDKGAVKDPRKVIPATGSLVSGMYVCKRSGLPQWISVRMKLYEDPTYRPPPRMPLQIEVLTSPTSRETTRFYVTRKFSEQSWALPAGMTYSEELADTGITRQATKTPMWVAGGLCLLGVLLLGVSSQRAARRGLFVAGGVCVLLAAAGLGTAYQRGAFEQPIEQAQAQQTIESLITNVYFAFAYRDESKIFDTLATSVDGPLLDTLYLDIQRGLSDAEDGGPTVRVLEVKIDSCEVLESTPKRLRANVGWVSAGSVSHWGHAHDRSNRYRAEVVAEPVDGRWRLTGVKILQEERI